MPAIRVVMPNGTTQSFREGTPKSVILQAQRDMIAEMQASGEFRDFDFANLDVPARKVLVTQSGARNEPGYTQLNPLGASPSSAPDTELNYLERDARGRYGISDNHLASMKRDAIARAAGLTAIQEVAMSLGLGRAAKFAGLLGKAGKGAKAVNDIAAVGLPGEIAEKVRGNYIQNIRREINAIESDALLEEDRRRGIAVSAGGGMLTTDWRKQWGEYD